MGLGKYLTDEEKGTVMTLGRWCVLEQQITVIVSK